MFGFISAICGRFKKEESVDSLAIKMQEECNAWDELVERTKKHEGFSSKPYKCPAGKLTIGYGRNIQDNGITQDEAKVLLMNDLETARDELERFIPWVITMSIRRQMVLVEMVFNMGIAKFKQFKKMIEYCRMGDYDKAADEAMNSLWAKQVGKRAQTLTKILKEG